MIPPVGLAAVDLTVVGGAAAYLASRRGAGSVVDKWQNDIQRYRALEAAWKMQPGDILLGMRHTSAWEPVWFRGQEMGVTIGSAGSSKFTAAIANNMLLYPGSAFVIDPKGEICAVTANFRKTYHRQNVYRLDPFNRTEFMTPTGPPLATYNPFDVLDPKLPSFEADAAGLAEAMTLPASNAKDRFWSDSAKELLIALICFVCTHPDAEGQRNLRTAFEYISAGEQGLKWLFLQMTNSPYYRVKNCGSMYSKMDEKTRDGIRQQLRSELYTLTDTEIADTMAKSSFRLEELFEGNATAYIILPAERLVSHSRWLRLMVAASMLVAGRYKRAQLRMPVLWMIDEAAHIGRLDEIPKAYGLLRGAGVRIWTFWQDLGQLKATYPEHWISLIGNSFNQLMSCGDLDTAKYFSELAGKSETIKHSFGTTQGTSTRPNLLGFGRPTISTSQSHNVSTQFEDRLRVDQIVAMQPHEQYIRFPNTLPFIAVKYPYHKDPILSVVAAKNPYYHSR